MAGCHWVAHGPTRIQSTQPTNRWATFVHDYAVRAAMVISRLAARQQRQANLIPHPCRTGCITHFALGSYLPLHPGRTSSWTALHGLHPEHISHHFTTASANSACLKSVFARCRWRAQAAALDSAYLWLDEDKGCRLDGRRQDLQKLVNEKVRAVTSCQRATSQGVVMREAGLRPGGSALSN